MSLFGRLFGGKSSESAVKSTFAETYNAETKEAVRKWLMRFFKDGDAQPEFWQNVDVYKTRNGHEPKVNDVIWGMLNNRRSKHFEQGNLGLYRNDTLSMCELLWIEERFRDQFRLAVHITVLDGCGAANVGWNAPGGVFREDEAFVAPICAAMLSDCGKSIGLSFDGLRAAFFEEAQEFQLSFGKRNPRKSIDVIWSQVADSVKEGLAAPSAKKRKSIKPPILNSGGAE